MTTEALACVTCGAPSTHGLVVGDETTWYCWNHDAGGEVSPVRAAWRRYNGANNTIQSVWDEPEYEGEQPTRAMFEERDAAKGHLEGVLRAEGAAEAVRQRDEAIALLRQAAGDFDYLVQMVMANDPKRINNGTKHRQNGIIAEVVAVGAQGGARARAFLSNFPEEDK